MIRLSVVQQDQIEVTVIIVVAPSRPSASAYDRCDRTIGNAAERAVAAVVVEERTG